MDHSKPKRMPQRIAKQTARRPTQQQPAALTKSLFYSHFSRRLGLPLVIVRRLFGDLQALTQREVRRKGGFAIPGLVRFERQSRKARAGRNPATGEPIKIPPTTVLKVRVSRELEAALSPMLGASARPPKAVKAFRKRGLRAKVSLKRPRPVKLPPNAEVVRVFYGTDRRPAASRPEGHFTTERGNALSFGWCDVSIPRDHRLAVIERPRITRLEFREDPKKHFVILLRTSQSPEQFWTGLQGLNESSVLIFIHGFGVIFDDALYRAAQLCYDLEFQGVPMVYSWASSGSKARYTADLGNNDFTVETLKRFLVEVARKSGVQTIHVVAHSMGNRALVNALFQLADRWRTDGLPRIENLLLTAPDIDRAVFLRLAAAMATTANKTTLYASSKDKALKLSKKLQIYPRAGDADDIVVVAGIDSIDATQLKTDFLSHSYYGDHRSVLSDFHELLEYGAPPARRFGLHGVPRGTPRYWEFRPSR